MRGIQGAGKSTYVKNNFPNSLVCSADDYYLDDKGNYKWDSSKIEEAHESCKFKFMLALINKEPLIVVDNTNTRLLEFETYIKEAKSFGYNVKVIRIMIDPIVGAMRNVHGVPLEIVQKFHSRFEPYPTELIIK